MKRNYLLGACLLFASTMHAQLNIQSGATFMIQSGATVTVLGDVTSNADIQGPGTLQMKGTALQNLNMNGFTVQNLQIENANNVALGSAAVVGTLLNFVSGKILLGGNDLSIASAASITGFDNSKYVVTDGAGQLKKNGLGTTAFTFPVGVNTNTYNPLTVAQNGTSEDIGIRVLANVLNAGTSGSAFVKEVVDASWVMTESVAGNNNLSLTSSWAASDELPGFNRNKTGISNFDGSTWDLTNAQTGAAAGAGPFTITRNSVANVGAFAVGTRPVLTPLLVAPKIFLQGAYNAGTGMMNDNLRSAGLIPTTEPYTGMTSFAHSGSGGAETIPSAVLAATGTGTDIVDWVFAELRDGSTGAVITTRAVLVQRNGNVVDVDGTNTKVNFINFAGELPNNYFVAIRHRNHLGVRSASTIALSKTSSIAFDYTNSLSQAFPGSVTNNAMATLSAGVFGLWGGDVNSNKNVKFNGPGNDLNALLNTCLSGNKSITLTGYSNCDINMNGNTKFNGPGNDLNFLLNSVLGGDKSKTITQPAF